MAKFPHDAGTYASSNYWVMLPDGVLFLRPWVRNASLNDLHKKFGVRTSAIVSPCNPRGKKLSDKANHSLMAAFANDLADRWKLFLSAGSELGGKRQSEKSCLVLGIGKKDALKLGRRYRQHAVVFCSAKSMQIVPELLACVSSNQKLFSEIRKRKSNIKSRQRSTSYAYKRRAGRPRFEQHGSVSEEQLWK